MDDTGVMIHNAISFVVALVVLLLISIGCLAGTLRLSNRIFQRLGSSSTPEAAASWRRRVRRTWLLLVMLLIVVLGAGAGFATWQQIQIDVVVWNWLSTLSQADVIAGGIALAEVLGIVLLAVLVNFLLRSLSGFLTTRLNQAGWVGQREQDLAEALLRLRLALRAVVLLGALIGIDNILALPESVRGILLLAAYIGIAVYVSRFIVCAAHLAIDVLFEMSDRLAALESPIRFLGSLKHLGALTKRTVEYFVYVSTATWVLDQITPENWLAQAGRMGIRIIAIFYISRVLAEVCLIFMNEFFLARKPGQSDAEYQQHRTLVPVAAGVVRYGIYFAALTTILREAGLDPTTILAGAGIVGVAVGLGAQAFVGDIVAGFFILFENLFLVGDLIEADGVKGQVEGIGLRITKIRDDFGVLHSIPNGDMRKVANHSRGYVNATVDVSIPHEADLQQVIDLLSSASQGFWDSGILAEAEVKLQEVQETGVVLRAMVRVRPGMDDDISDRLRKRLLDALRTAGVGVPRAQHMVWMREYQDGAAILPESRSETNHEIAKGALNDSGQPG
jgi:small conductance mechanosensitive channel